LSTYTADSGIFAVVIGQNFVDWGKIQCQTLLTDNLI
jgi:hypothetical protein